MAFRLVKVIVAGDSKGAVRALQEVGTEAELTSRKVAASNRKTEAGFAGVGKSAEKTKHHFSLMGAAVGLGGLAFGLKDVISAGEKWQVQQVSLQKALQNTGQYSAANMEKLKTAAEHLATHGGFAAPENLAGLTRFEVITKSASKAVVLNAAATNLARGAHLDYGKAVMLVARAEATGSIGRAAQYVPGIVAVKTHMDALTAAHKVNILQIDAHAKALGKGGAAYKTLALAQAGITPAMKAEAVALDKAATSREILAAIQHRYAGQTAAYSRTTQGQMSNLKNSAEILAANLGTVLLPAINKIVGALADAARWLAKHKTLALIVIGVIAGLTLTYYAVTAAVALWGAATTLGAGIAAVAAAANGALETTLIALMLAADGVTLSATLMWSAITLGVAAAVIGLIWVVTHWKQVKRAAAEAWQWIKDHWLLIAPILGGPFGIAVAYIITHFTKVKHFLLGVVHSIGGFFSGLWHDVTSTAGRAVDWLLRKFAWLVHQVKSLPGKALHGIKSFLHDPLGIGVGVPSFAHGGIIPGFATGGMLGGFNGPVGGFGNADNVPINVTPGEYVVRREAVQAVGRGTLDAINSGGHPASSGGGGGDIPIVIPITLRTGERQIAETVVHYILKKKALG